MTDRKILERYDEFARDFLKPLLEGGTTCVGAPVSPGMLDAFGAVRPTDPDIDLAIQSRLFAEASDLTRVRSLPWPDRGLAAVTMACHDLAAVTDPLLDRWLARRARETILEWVDWFLEEAGAPQTRGEALVRHVIVSRALSLRREDVVVKNWAYTYRFFGRPVPKRVLAMPRLRMVRQQKDERTVLALWESLEEELEVGLRIDRLLCRSPITQLLRTDRTPELVLGTASLAVLSDDLLRNAVARELVAQGPRVAAPFGHALRNLAEAEPAPPPSMLYYALALIYEVHVIATLDARANREPPFGQPESPDERLFTAVLPAVLGAPDDLDALLDLDPEDLRLLREHAPDLSRTAGVEATRLAVELVDRATPPRLDHERDPGTLGGRARTAAGG